MSRNVGPRPTDPLDDLLALPSVYLDASYRCHEAGDIPAAVGELAKVLEGVLLGAVLAYEDEVREAGRWPKREPTQLHLSELVKLAHKMEWLSASAVEQCELLNQARNVATHPGALVRGSGASPAFTTPYKDLYLVVVKSCAEVFAAHGASLDEHGERL